VDASHALVVYIRHYNGGTVSIGTEQDIAYNANRTLMVSPSGIALVTSTNDYFSLYGQHGSGAVGGDAEAFKGATGWNFFNGVWIGETQ